VHARAWFLLAAAAAGLSAADYAAEGKLWWAHIQFLADDRLEGRAVGSPGYLKAVQYVQTQFDKLGLQPAGTKGYLQPVRFETRQITESSVELIVDGKVARDRAGSDAERPGGRSACRRGAASSGRRTSLRRDTTN
jgi:hypothetical protein